MSKLVKKETADVIISDQAPDYISLGSERGSESVQAEDLVIPRLEIVQGLSPALKRTDPKYVEGAKVGDLVNSVTRQLYGDHVFVVPVYFTKQWLVWRDKRLGGGFGGAYETEDQARIQARERGDGWEVIDTPQHLCLTAAGEEILISMPRTKAKVSRQWNSMIRLTGGDRFSRVYKISTVEQSNEKGSFCNYNITLVGFPSKSLYKRAEVLYEQMRSGEKKVVMHVDEEEENGVSEM